MHDLTLAAQFTDRVALLTDGRLAASGTPEQVLRPDTLARSFGGSVQVLTGEDGRLMVVPQRSARR